MKHVSIITLLAAGWLVSSGALRAQYSLDWHTIDSGGAVSTGGSYTLDGTFGQPDANPVMLTGGSYEMEGGFWAGVVVAPTGEGPTLFIQLSGASIILTWTPATPGYTLQQTDSLTAPSWISAPSGNPTAPIPATTGTRYYRLIKP